MIVGSTLNNPAFIKSIEDQGGLVVTDELLHRHPLLVGPGDRDGE